MNKKTYLNFFSHTCTECSLSIQKSIPKVTFRASTFLQIKSLFYNKGVEPWTLSLYVSLSTGVGS